MSKKKELKHLILALCCGALIMPVNAQEVLVPAGIPVRGTRPVKKSVQVDTQPDTLDLPFFDDFSRSGPRPHSPLWIDDDAFVNSSYTLNPLTIGVATLDAIDAEG